METVEYCFDHEWTLAETQIRKVLLCNVKRFISKSFMADNIPGLKYYFAVTPKKKTSENTIETGVHIFVEYGKPVPCKFTVEVPSTGYSNKATVVFANGERGWGKNLCLYKDLMKPENRWLINGKLTIKITGTFKVELPFTRAFSNSSPLLTSLWDRDDKDFTFIVDGKRFKVHKFVLSNLSFVFDTMLQTQWKETEEGQMTIEDFDADVVEAAILCFYEKFTNVSLPISMELLRFADKYDISSLKDEMERYLIKKVSKAEVVKLANASVMANAEKLNRRCLQFLAKGNKYCTVPDIKELNTDMKDQLLEIAFTNAVKCENK